MRNVSVQLQMARHMLAQGKGWLLFVEIALANPAGFVRLVSNPVHVEAAGKMWQACAMQIVLPAESADGTLGQLSLAIPNVSRLPMTFIAGVDRLNGQLMTCWMAHEDSLVTLPEGLAWQHRILAVDADETSFKVECGHPSSSQRGPSQLYDRSRFPQLLPGGGLSLNSR